jgi:PKD repeat protein
VPLVVQFTDESIAGTAPITDWLWNFGDGNTDTSQNPQYTYHDPGTYTVSLTVTADQESDTETKPDYINAGCFIGAGTLTPPGASGAGPHLGDILVLAFAASALLLASVAGRSVRAVW